MRTVTYGAACSLDGFIAAADGSIDWLHFSKDVQDEMSRYWATIDTMLMGRKTWSVAAAHAGGGGGASPGMGAISTYIFSRTLTAESVPGAHLVSSDAGEFVRNLKQQPGKGICLMGGGELAQSLFTAGVIDEVSLNIHPVILGAGLPFFRDPGRRIALKLTEARTIHGGCVLASYRVKAPEPPRRARKR